MTFLVDPRSSQNMITKYLSVGQWSWILYQQVALDALFQMRYGSLPNSKKQPSDSQRGRETSCFHIKAWLFCLLLCTLSSPGVCQHPSSFCSVTLSLLGAYQAAMSHLKEDSNTFHMTSNTLILGSSYGRTSTSPIHIRTSLVLLQFFRNVTGPKTLPA